MTEADKGARAARRPSLVQKPSVVEKVFKPVVKTQRRIRLDTPEMRTHPTTVMLDLKTGSIDTFTAYLRKHRGIPDSDVCDAILRLLDGAPEETPYQLAVIRHPGLKPNEQLTPNPKSARQRLRQRDVAIFSWYEDIIRTHHKQYAAIHHMVTVPPEDDARKSALGKITEHAVREALRRVAAADDEEQQRLADEIARAATNDRREMALARMREKAAKPDVSEGARMPTEGAE